MRRERVVLFLWPLFVGAGLLLLGMARSPNVASYKPATPGLTSQPSRECHLVRYMPVRFRAGSDPYWADWDLCHEDDPDPPENYVMVKDNRGDEVYAFEPGDQIQRLEREDFDHDGNEQLLFVSMASGTGNYIDWCVLGWTKRRLDCWTVPDIDSPVKKLLKPDEDFCCKDWTLKVANGKIVLGEGIYHTGPDGNCCPSRGGAFVELSPDHGKFQLTKVWRTDIKAYENWTFSR